MTQTDPALLTAALIRCASVTPEEGGALVLLQSELEAAGFDCTRVDRGGISNPMILSAHRSRTASCTGAARRT